MAQGLISTPRVKAVILNEASGQRSRENSVLVSDGAAFASGTVLTQSGDTTPTGTVAATAGNTGNPNLGVVSIGAKGLPGVYKLRFTAPTKFDVEDPEGVTIGTGTVGTAFNKAGVSFTATAGGTAAVAGDEFTITVGVGTRKYSRYAASGASGPAHAVLYNYVPVLANAAEVKVVTFVRSAELNRFELTGLDATAEADLKKVGLIVRGTPGLPTVSTPVLTA